MKIIVDMPGVHLEVHTQPVRVHTVNSPIVESAQLSPFAVPQFSLTSALCLYVYTFCRNLGLPAEFSRLVLHLFSDPNSHQLDRIHIGFELPPEVAAAYRSAFQPAQQRALQSALEQLPIFQVDFQPSGSSDATLMHGEHPNQ